MIKNSKLKIKNYKAAALSLMLILGLGFAVFKLTEKPAKADWYDEGWAYRKSLTFTNSGSAVTNQMVKLEIDTATLITAGKLQSSCQDARFTDAGGALLQYYINVGGGAGVGCNDASSDFYVLLPSIPVGGNLVWFYYGNSNAAAGTQAATFNVTQFTTGTVTTGSEGTGPGPVAYWKFDEGTGTTTTDATANKLVGTLSGSTLPTWQTEDLCLSGKCLYYDGSTSHTVISDPGTKSVLDFTSGDTITMEAWINPKSLPASGNTLAILFKGSVDNTDDANYVLDMYNNSGSYVLTFSYVRTGFGGSGGYDTYDTTTSVLQTNTWQHIALTYTFATGSSLKFYYNGKLQSGAWEACGGCGGNSTPSETNKALWLGADDYNGCAGVCEAFPGKIDDVKIYRYARTAAQINADYVARGVSKGASAVLGSNDQNLAALSNGLVGYWKLDDNTGTAPVDSSGNGNTGTMVNTPTWATGKFGTGLTFVSASSEYMSQDSVHVGDRSAFTISVWYKTSSTTKEKIYSEGSSGSNTPRVYISINENTTNDVEFGMLTDSNSFAGAASQTNGSITNAADGSWHHVVAVQQSLSSRQLYFDGVLKVSDSTTFGTVTLNESTLGANRGVANSNFFSGTADDLRLYNRALSGAEVAQLYNWAPGPIGYWKMDETSGTSVADTSGNNFTLTRLIALGSATDTNPQWGPGKFGNAPILDGLRRIERNSTTDLDQGSAGNLTLEAWIYPTTTQCNSNSNCGIISKQDASSGSNPGFKIMMFAAGQGGDICGMFEDGNGAHEYAPCSSGNAFVANTWYHVAAVLDRGSAANSGFYLNGVRNTDPSQGSNLDPTLLGSMTNAAKFNIGGFYNFSGNNFEGRIDDVRVYNYARTPKQIVQDMNGGHPVGGSPVGSQYLYWKMDEQNGSSLNDSGFGGTTGTITTAAWLLPNSCKVNGCLNFVNTTDKVSAGDITGLDAQATMSATFWINPQTLTGSRAIMSKDNTNQETFKIETWSVSSELKITISNALNDSSNYFVTQGLGLAANAWQHIAVVYDAGQANNADRIKVYKNGVQAGGGVTGTIPYGLRDGTANFQLGQSQAATSALPMFLDEVKIYSGVALNQADINIDMNNGSAVSLGGVVGTHDSEGFSMPSPALYWDFNGNTGTGTSSVADKSGNNASGNLFAPATWTTGKIGSGIDCATTGYVATTSVLTTATTNISMEVWVYWKSASQAAVIFYNGNSGSNGYGLYVSNGSGSAGTKVTVLRGGLGFDTTTSTLTLPTNQWTHLALTRDSTTWKLYKNGVLDSTGSANPNTPGTSTNVCGVSGSLTGIVDEAKFYTSTLTQAQIVYDMNRGAPVAQYKFDECSGSTAYNTAPAASGLTPGMDGTLTPGASGNTTTGTCSSGTNTEMWNNGTTGKINASVDLDGTDDYVEIADNSALRFDSSTQDFSVFAWVKRNTSGANQYIIDKLDAANDGWLLQFNSADTVTCKLNSTAITSSSTITDTNWHHIGCVVNRSGTGQIYIDGSANGPAVTTSSITMATTSVARIGAQSFATITNYLDAQVDDLRIYNYALSATQVKQIYNNGAVFFGPSQGTP